MFARRVTMNLKPNCAPEFTRKMETDVIPLLQKQTGFKDEIAFITTGDKALAISLWDRREDADAYNSGRYQEVVKLLATVVDGTPHVESGEVSTSTFHKTAAAATR